MFALCLKSKFWGPPSTTNGPPGTKQAFSRLLLLYLSKIFVFESFAVKLPLQVEGILENHIKTSICIIAAFTIPIVKEKLLTFKESNTCTLIKKYEGATKKT